MKPAKGKRPRRLWRIGCVILLLPCAVVGLFLAAIGPLPLPDSPTAVPATFPADFQKGITYEAWWHGEYASANSDTTLVQLIKPTDANWIAVIVKCAQKTIPSTEIACDTNAATPAADDIAHVIETAHKLGLRVMLKPHIDMADPTIGRNQINFRDDQTAWRKWFGNYTQFITYYARLAQRLGADYFVVRTELSGTVDYEAEWREVIRQVRAVYSGSLTYASLPYGEDYRIMWWDALDAIGINAYFPLTLTTRPNLTKLELGWMPAVLWLENLYRRWNRPIIFTEIGYLSVAGTNRSPANWAIDGATDLQEHANCYQAVFDVFEGKAWWHGVFWWSWSTDPGQGGATDRTYAVYGKPAEDVLKLYFEER